jgi:hypothetical protein
VSANASELSSIGLCAAGCVAAAAVPPPLPLLRCAAAGDVPSRRPGALSAMVYAAVASVASSLALLVAATSPSSGVRAAAAASAAEASGGSRLGKPPALPQAYWSASDVHFTMPGLGSGEISEWRFADADKTKMVTIDMMNDGPGSSLTMHFQTATDSKDLVWNPDAGSLSCTDQGDNPPLPNAINASSVLLAADVVVNGKHCEMW